MLVPAVTRTVREQDPVGRAGDDRVELAAQQRERLAGHPVGKRHADRAEVRGAGRRNLRAQVRRIVQSIEIDPQAAEALPAQARQAGAIQACGPERRFVVARGPAHEAEQPVQLRQDTVELPFGQAGRRRAVKAQLPDRAHAGQQGRMHGGFPHQAAKVVVQRRGGVRGVRERGQVQAQRERPGLPGRQPGDCVEVVEAGGQVEGAGKAGGCVHGSAPANARCARTGRFPPPSLAKRPV